MDTICELEKQVYSVDFTEIENPSCIQTYYFNESKSDSNGYIAIDMTSPEEEKIVGVLLYTKYEYSSVININSLCVNPNFRNIGIASTLLRIIIDENEGFSLSLQVSKENKEALSLYNKIGFIKEALIPNYYVGYSNRGKEGSSAYFMMYKQYRKYYDEVILQLKYVLTNKRYDNNSLFYNFWKHIMTLLEN